MKEVKVGILGFGGIARAHKAGYDLLAKEGAPIRLVALCDIDEKQFQKALEINIEAENASAADALRLYTDLDEMLEQEDLDAVDVCLPTYLHKEYVLKLLAAGYHVQSEKPMALSSDDCAQMCAAAKKAGKYLLIGQCLRYSADYLALKEIIDSGKYGKVLSMEMERLSSLPLWGFEHWFQDEKRSGGVMLDMGIHDTDMVRFLFGEPEEVSAVAIDGKTPKEWAQCRFFYPDGKIVSTVSSWAEASGFRFEASFRATLERATIVYRGGPIRVFADGECFSPSYEPKNIYGEESRALAELILSGGENLRNSPESAANTVALVEALKKSADQNGKPVKFKPVF